LSRIATSGGALTVATDRIREYPGYSPTLLRETPHGIGTAVVTLATGTDPFCRLRVPEITEQWAITRSAATAHHRRDPREVAASTITTDRAQARPDLAEVGTP
jgi:hypothetical protein